MLSHSRSKIAAQAIVLSLLFAFGSLCQTPTKQKKLRNCSKRDFYWDNCIGTYTFPDGKVYAGEFHDGKFNGQGTETTPDGIKYVGGFRNDIFYGQGTLTAPNGNQYVGQFGDSGLNGQGTLTYANGDKYVGEFRDGKFNGQGTLTYTDGGKYVGEFRDGKFNGQGTETWSNGSKSVGQFANGQFIGPANTPAANTQGQQNSKLPQCPEPATSYWDNCIGARPAPNGNVYVGEFHSNSFNGQGYLRYSDGSTYTGGFRDGQLEGQGTSTFPNGDTHVGEIHNNHANGQGTWTFANGDKYTGEFRDNNRTGQGTYTFANGTKLVGEFKDGTYIGSSAFEVRLDRQGGVLLVPVLINDKLPLDFVIDSGASDVSVPADVVSTLMRTGTLVPADFTGTQTYVLADGSKVPSQTFRIKSLKVGNLVLSDVSASVASANGSLLLGQSFLARFTSWSIDNARQVLMLGPKLF